MNTQQKMHLPLELPLVLLVQRVYDGIKAAGNWLGKQANKANAQSIYSAAPARKYACYIVNPQDHKDIDISEVAEFGR